MAKDLNFGIGKKKDCTICEAKTKVQLTNEMLQNNIIRESNSPWHSPVVLFKKKSNNEYTGLL